MSAAADTVFALARKAADVGDVLGVPAGARWRRLKVCPLCGGRDDFAYTASAFRCFKCGEAGDAVALKSKLDRLSPFEAACKLAGLDVEAQRTAYAAEHGVKRGPRKPLTPPPAAYATTLEVVARVKRRLVGAEGTIVERYLAARALPAAFARFVWFCADAPYDAGALWGRGRAFPAMVCVVTRGGRETGGLHLTYLRGDGAGKVDTLKAGEPAKKMWGPQSDGLGRPGGLLLIAPATPSAVLCVAEGVENALTLAAAVGGGAGAFAAGSLDRFQGGFLGGWKAPVPDPVKPAATVPHTGPVVLGVDADMKPLVLNAGTRFERVVTPARRAQVSGLLAAHWWRLAGASDVRVASPPAGKDWNQLVQEGAAA